MAPHVVPFQLEKIKLKSGESYMWVTSISALLPLYFSLLFLCPFSDSTLFFFLRGFWFHSRRQGKWGDRWRRGLASWISQNFILESSPFFTNKIYFGTVTLIQISRPLAKILIQQDFGGLISKCIMLVLHPLWRYFSPRVQFQQRYQDISAHMCSSNHDIK